MCVTTNFVCCILIPCPLSDATIKKRVNGWVVEEVNVREGLQCKIEKLKVDKKAKYKVISSVHVLKSIPAFPCSLVPNAYPSLANGHLIVRLLQANIGFDNFLFLNLYNFLSYFPLYLFCA
uniref:Uncharacterized protein n=1 Tax=Populus davidiana TaxID=266767 RepID=A0A6M2EUY2_9ROSI